MDYQAQLATIVPTQITGQIVRTVGNAAAAAGFPAPVGSLVEIERQGGTPISGEVIGFQNELTLVYPFGTLSGVRRGHRIRLVQTTRYLKVGDGLLGRVLNAHGKPLDGAPEPVSTERVPLDASAPAAVERPRIDAPLSTGIRTLDALLTCGRGQRMGIFSGAGVGKSTCLGMMARYSSADVIVIGLIGERGREVNEFIERDLGLDGLRRSVVVLATSDEPALLRVQSALAATAIAEYFRSQGKEVLLLMDSVTRFAQAHREVGLAAGEPPTTRGYPPSTFSALSRLVERAGRTRAGSITAFYSVLVDGDDPNEPISDTMRGLLDGHTFLSRKIAAQGRYPAIDVLESISRLMSDIAPQPHKDAAQTVRQLLAAYRDHEDLISIGAYRNGSNPTVDTAIAMQPSIQAFLRQRVDEVVTIEQARQQLLDLAARCAGTRGSSASDGTPRPQAANQRTLAKA